MPTRRRFAQHLSGILTARFVVYKHRYTRRSLHLDYEACPYRYVPPGADSVGGHGRYVRHKTIEHALDHLCLWELPWLKLGLEKYQCERSWNERWLLHPDADPRHDWERRDAELMDEEASWDWSPAPAEQER